MVDVREAAILRLQGLMDESYELLSAANARYPQEFWPWHSRTLAAIDMGYFDVAETLLATPPSTAVQEQGRVVKLRAQFDKARWALEAAINGFCAAINLDANDAMAVYERAKLKLITFDNTGAWLDLVAYAALRSTSTRKMNPMHSLVGQLYEEYYHRSHDRRRSHRAATALAARSGPATCRTGAPFPQFHCPGHRPNDCAASVGTI